MSSVLERVLELPPVEEVPERVLGLPWLLPLYCSSLSVASEKNVEQEEEARRRRWDIIYG